MDRRKINFYRPQESILHTCTRLIFCVSFPKKLIVSYLQVSWNELGGIDRSESVDGWVSDVSLPVGNWTLAGDDSLLIGQDEEYRLTPCKHIHI